MRQIICLALAVLACLPGFGGGTVDIDSCRRMALENNKSLRMSEEGIRGAEYARKAARSAYLPGIDFVMSYFYNQHQTSLLSADAKLPTATFNPVTQGFDLSSMDIDYIGRSLPQSTQNFLPSIYPCLMGLLLAIVSWLVLRVTAKKEG